MPKRRALLSCLAVFCAAAIAAFVVVEHQVGTGQSASPASSTLVDGTPELMSDAELKAEGYNDEQIAEVRQWTRDKETLNRLQAEHAPSYNVIPEPIPRATLEWCDKQAANPDPEVDNLAERCEIIELAAEGRIKSGVYTDAELSAAKNQAKEESGK